ncbi:MAG TPA: hypothetical protein VEL70_07205 [Candidatus Acidoferrum sp.]|nr:hypothetical protein [Candidatus Acidoferrum sp.]
MRYSQATSNDNNNNTFYNNQLIYSPSAISGLQNNKPSSDIAKNHNVKMHSHHTHH